MSNPDLRIGGSHVPFSGGDVRATFEQLGRQTHWNRRRRARSGFDRDGKRRGRLADEHGNRVFILRSRNSDIDCRGLRALQSCLRFDNGDLVSNASVVRRPYNFQCFLVGIHCVIEDLLQCVLAVNLKEVLGKAGLFSQPLILKIGSGQLRGILAGAHRVAHFPPEVRLPRHIGRK